MRRRQLQRPASRRLEELGELDVIGPKFKERTAFLCEVSTHIGGLYIRSGNNGTMQRIYKKHERQKAYAEAQLPDFTTRHFMFWPPRVPVGQMTDMLKALPELELVINHTYTEKVNQLRAIAKKHQNDESNDAFRMLQILECLR